jgi:hypothetical protein
MTKPHRPRGAAVLVLAGALLVGAPVVTGCSLIGSVVEGATGGNIPEGLDAGTTVPADFPSEVPLIDGEVVFALSLPADNGEKAWNVTINVGGPDAFEAIRTQLTDAGFEYQEVSSGDSGSGGAFRKDGLTVLVTVAAATGDQWTANYTVTNAETGQ